jgi:hypothetical protein
MKGIKSTDFSPLILPLRRSRSRACTENAGRKRLRAPLR